MNKQMNVKEAAEYIGIDSSHVRRLIKSGKLEAKKNILPIGGYYYTVSKNEADKCITEYNRGSKIGRPRGYKIV